MGVSTKNMIFVFGSNLEGIHGAGAARYAKDYLGAAMGMGIGRTGQCYAIPTKGTKKVHPGFRESLPIETIKVFVEEFIDYACNNPHYQFQITCIGCGLASFKHEEIAPMFATAPSNCWFDSAWQHIFDEQYHGRHFNYWGTF